MLNIDTTKKCKTKEFTFRVFIWLASEDWLLPQ